VHHGVAAADVPEVRVCDFEEWACNRCEVDQRAGWVCFEAGEAEQVVDEAAESFAVAGDGCFEAVALA
jgi:hypothetical protein